MSPLPRIYVVLVLAGFVGTGPADAIDFEKEVRPLLKERCVECHGAAKQKGELRLDARSFAMKGGHDGAAIVAGRSGESPLYQRLVSHDKEERMPPKGDPLSAAQGERIRQWIDEGATGRKRRQIVRRWWTNVCSIGRISRSGRRR